MIAIFFQARVRGRTWDSAFTCGCDHVGLILIDLLFFFHSLPTNLRRRWRSCGRSSKESSFILPIRVLRTVLNRRSHQDGLAVPLLCMLLCYLWLSALLLFCYLPFPELWMVPARYMRCNDSRQRGEDTRFGHVWVFVFFFGKLYFRQRLAGLPPSSVCGSMCALTMAWASSGPRSRLR